MKRAGIGHRDKQQDGTHGQEELARRPEHEATDPDQRDDNARRVQKQLTLNTCRPFAAVPVSMVRRTAPRDAAQAVLWRS